MIQNRGIVCMETWKSTRGNRLQTLYCSCFYDWWWKWLACYHGENSFKRNRRKNWLLQSSFFWNLYMYVTEYMCECVAWRQRIVWCLCMSFCHCAQMTMETASSYMKRNLHQWIQLQSLMNVLLQWNGICYQLSERIH